MPEEYRGPILCVVHSPLFHETDKASLGFKRQEANKRRIEQALRKAALNGIPVIYEAYPESRPALENFVKGLKRKPRIIWANTIDPRVKSSESIGEILARERIVPSKAVFFGIFRDACVAGAATNFRNSFSRARIEVIRGNSTIFVPSPNSGSTPRQQRKSLEEHFERERIGRAKKLNPRHLV